MAKTKKKKDFTDTCLNYLQRAINDSETIVNNAEANLEAYRRDPYGNEIEGRSQFVSSDVSDTVEWIMPSLMKLFYGGTDVVTIGPKGSEDETKAKLMNAKINFDFMQEQNGFILLHDWFKAALMNKISVVKYWWEQEKVREFKAYSGLTADELASILSTVENIDEDSIELTENDDDMTFDVEFYVETEREYPLSELLPPEEVVFEIRSRVDMKHAEFVAHKKRVHKNYLKSKYKVKESDLEQISTEFDNGTTLEETRFEDLGGIWFVTDDRDNDFYYIYECYLNDYDKNGEPVPMKVVVLGNKTIDQEENTYGRPNFCSLSSIRMPHRAAGMSVADLMVDLQALRTSLTRAVMDNIYYQNNGINVVNPYRVNIDDVINRKEPGASWRTLDDIDPSSAIFPVPHTPIAPQTMEMMQVVEQMGEKRTGVSQTAQGLDPNTLNNNASGAVGSMMNAANQRIELIARLFAETGVLDLFEQYVNMNLNFLTQETAVRTDEGWAEINPTQIQGKYDVLVDVGVGTAAKEVQLNQLITLIQTAYPQAMQLGVVTSENYYNTLVQIYELMGYKNGAKYATNPEQDVQMQQIHQQYEAQIQQLQQVNQALQVELQSNQLDKEIDQQKVMIDQQKVELEKVELMLKEKQMELKYQTDVMNIIAPETGAGSEQTNERGTDSSNAPS